nr:response regulator transcription factor [Amnibacterium setariae]
MPDAGPVRILLVDDQALFRSGLRMLLDSQDDLEVVGEAADGEEGVAAAAALDPDVVLMDIRMPRVDGVTATERLAERGVRPKVLVLTTFDLDEAAARALRAGASGFVLKDAKPEFLLAAVRTVHAGAAVIAPAAIGHLLDTFGSGRVRRDDELAVLSPREREIYDLAGKGLSNAEIAAHEYVSEATVKTHVSRILAKLGLRDRVQLVVHWHAG